MRPTSIADLAIVTVQGIFATAEEITVRKLESNRKLMIAIHLKTTYMSEMGIKTSAYASVIHEQRVCVINEWCAYVMVSKIYAQKRPCMKVLNTFP